MVDLKDTLAERGSRYGDFTEHADIAQDLQDCMRIRDGWPALSPVQKQALTVIADKIARILSGDPNYTDNWHDIQGYAKLAEDRCVDTTTPQLDLGGTEPPTQLFESQPTSAEPPEGLEYFVSHSAQRQGDEYYCADCGKRWSFDESAPPCA